MKKMMLLVAALGLCVALSGCEEKDNGKGAAAPAGVAVETEAEPVTEITYEESGEIESENFSEETGEILEETAVEGNLSVDQDFLTVEVASNPSTGYTWHYVIADESLLTMMSEKFFEAQAEATMVGVGGTQQYIFQGKAEGETWLYLFYVAPGEEFVVPAEEEIEAESDMAIHVSVNDKGYITLLDE